MNSLFGLSMNTIMIWMLAIFLIVTAIVAVLALRNTLFFKMGLRNIPRRRAQTILIIVGLMLSTVIITSAFSTGDTVSYSIRNATIQSLGFIDETVTSTPANQSADAAGGVAYIPPPVQSKVLSSLAANHNVDGYTTITARYAALQDITSGQTKNQNVLAGIPADVPAAFGPLIPKNGGTVTIGQLGANQVYLNQKAADDLNAQPGDSILVYVGNRPVTARVQAILQNQNLASGGLLSRGQATQPTVIAPLSWVRTVIGQPNAVTQILISNQGGLTSGVSFSDGITNQLRALLANTSVVAQVQTLLVTPSGKAALAKAISDASSPTIKNKLKSLQAQVVVSGQSASLKSLLSDSDVTDALANMKAPASLSAPLNNALASISDYHVEPLKKNGLDAADLFGSVFTSIFVVFGLFSIAAGVMLIFLIFVMLAAERRPEMGMARAVGTQRRHLIQQFLFEGYTYDLGSAVVGVILGVAVGLGMVRILTAVINNVSSDFSLTGHVEPRSLVVAFCLGALVTFITVAVSSVRVSRLNVVAAIRDLPEQFGVKTHAGHSWQQTKDEFAAIRRSKLRIIFWVVALPMFLIPPLGITYLVLRVLWYLRHLLLAFLARGPLFLIAGLLILLLGLSTKQQGFFSLGGSLLIIGAAMLARWIMQGAGVPDPIRNRIGYSAAGLGLVVFWLLPFDFWSNLGVPALNAGPEMFFLSGLMMVLGAVWTVMYNIDILLGALLVVFGGIGHLAPMIKMAVTYPTQHKFRTGLTLSMFSLVIFTLMFMSVLVGSSSSTLVMNRDTGGYQIYGAVNPNNP
ncbi:MAG TPA: FtsX-like permease family protein, partial [Chloroflexota bacterium]